MTLTAIFYLLFYFVGLGKALAGKPIWGLYIYFFAFYFHAPSQWWGKALPDLRWSLLAALVTLIALLMYPPKEGFRFWTFRENRWLTIFAVFVCIQTAFSISTSVHLVYVFLLLKFIFFMFLLQNTVFSLSDLKGVVWVNIISGAYLAYLGMSMHSGGRLEGIGTPGMESANQLGQHFSVLFLMGGYLLIEKFNKFHIIFIIALSMILMALFMTESRGVIIALGATGFIAVFFMPKGSKKKLSIFGILAVVASGSLMGPQIVDRFVGMQTDSTGDIEDASARSRVIIIDAQIEMFNVSPIVGHGHAGTSLLSTQYIPDDYLSTEVGARSSHNVVMSFLVDHGVVGSFLYFGAIFVCCWRIFATKSPPINLSDDVKEEYRVLSNLMVGCVLALICFMLGGLGSNNKKLEADIWLLAIVPVIHRRMQNLKGEKLPFIVNKEVSDVNKQ
jgi:O-antigen ligase